MFIIGKKVYALYEKADYSLYFKMFIKTHGNEDSHPKIAMRKSN